MTGCDPSPVIPSPVTPCAHPASAKTAQQSLIASMDVTPRESVEFARSLGLPVGEVLHPFEEPPPKPSKRVAAIMARDPFDLVEIAKQAKRRGATGKKWSDR